MATATRSTNYEFGCLSVCDAEGEVEVVSSPACSSGCQVSIPRCCITMAFVSSHAGLRDAHKYWCLQRQRNQALGKHGLRLMLPKDGDIPKACSSTCTPGCRSRIAYVQTPCCSTREAWAEGCRDSAAGSVAAESACVRCVIALLLGWCVVKAVLSLSRLV